MMQADAIAARYGSRVGEKVGFLTFVALSETRGDNNRIYGRFACICGWEIEAPVGRTLAGKRTHCGCRTDRGAHRTHGMRNSPEYSSWQSMKGRCLDPDNKDYPRWGGKGVTVHPEWVSSFESFFAHIGPRPAGTSLDRIDNTKNYEPGNVRWATPVEQQRNRSTSYRWHIKGLVFETHTEAANHFGVSDHAVWRWVHGQHDRRRNSFTPPREDCHVVARY